MRLLHKKLFAEKEKLNYPVLNEEDGEADDKIRLRRQSANLAAVPFSQVTIVFQTASINL
jgi:hypothetical protein